MYILLVAFCHLKINSNFHLSLFKHEYTIILYQNVSCACGYLYSVMILLHVSYGGVVCYEIMKHGNMVNDVNIEVFPFKINITFLIRKEKLLCCVRAMCVNT